jgi:hypothetical protein
MDFLFPSVESVNDRFVGTQSFGIRIVHTHKQICACATVLCAHQQLHSGWHEVCESLRESAWHLVMNYCENV